MDGEKAREIGGRFMIPDVEGIWANGTRWKRMEKMNNGKRKTRWTGVSVWVKNSRQGGVS